MKALVGDSVPSDEAVLSDDVVVLSDDVGSVPRIGVGDGADELLGTCLEDTKLLCAGNEVLKDEG